VIRGPYGITGLPPVLAGAAQVEALWRGHRAIENKVHHMRDRTTDEDAGQVCSGSAPQALAALSNGVLSLLRSFGRVNVADALRLPRPLPVRLRTRPTLAQSYRGRVPASDLCPAKPRGARSIRSLR
jgi:hypothetical protein